jgi:hypothetical protein
MIRTNPVTATYEGLSKPSGNPAAAEAALISALTTVQHKRELFAKHAQHLDALADEVERAMAATNDGSCYAFE